MTNTIHEVFPYLRVRDANAAIEFYKQAFGAEEKFRLSERIAKLLDPFGHDWMLGTHIEDVTPEETQRRFNALLEDAKKPS